MQYSQEHLKTMVYAKFGGQTECIMGNSKRENVPDSLIPESGRFLDYEWSPFFHRDTAETRARVKITPRKKGDTRLFFSLTAASRLSRVE